MATLLDVRDRADGLEALLAAEGTTAFDLFRYSAPGVTTLNPNATGLYFSDDGGKTVVNTFNPPGNGGDIQDWAGSTPPDSFDAFGDTMDPNVYFYRLEGGTWHYVRAAHPSSYIVR